MNITTVKGARDLYPADMRQRRAMQAKCRPVLEGRGYEEYEAPVLESFALYEAKSSAEIIERQSFTFTDRGGERLVVRPELTPSLARMVAAKQAELPPILRWYSWADCWRYERPQKGRSRNFLQLNVDLLGADSVEADVEVIVLAFELLQGLGFNMDSIEMRLNDRQSFDALCDRLIITVEQRGAFLTLLDERDKLSAEDFMQKMQEIQPGFDETSLASIDQMVPTERLTGALESVRRAGWTQVSYNPQLVRGFSYYTGIVFEVFETSGQFKRAIFGGGRYDNLLEAFGGKSMSGIGFGVSDVALFVALAEQKKAILMAPADRKMVIPYSEAEVAGAREVARRLREQEKVAITALPPYELKKQLRLADRMDVTKAYILMPEEWQRGQVIVKDLRTGEQALVDFAELL